MANSPVSAERVRRAVVRGPAAWIAFVVVAAAAVAATGLFAPDPAVASGPAAPRGYGRLVIITNFDATEIQIGSTSYPYEYIDGQQRGVLVPAGVTFRLVVSTSPEKRRTFNLRLDSGETRILVVDLENMGAVRGAPPAGEPAAPAAPPPAQPVEGANPGEEGNGFLGVASTPRASVVIDGAPTEHKTPARRIELPPGQHTVQVTFDDGTQSEVKNVLIRSGINTSVYFRPPNAGVPTAVPMAPPLVRKPSE
jgi:hypothetical protein